MWTHGELDVVPAVWPSRIVGAVPFILHLELAADADEDDRLLISRSIDDSWMHQYSPPDAEERCMDFMMAAPSMGDAEEVRLQAESLAGVSCAAVLVPNMVRASEAWLDEAIAARVAQGESKPTKSRTPRPDVMAAPAKVAAARQRRAR